MKKDIKIKNCGAKTRKETQCQNATMPNGRCRMHRGVAYKEIKHGRLTNGAFWQRKKEGFFLKEMRILLIDIKKSLKVTNLA